MSDFAIILTRFINNELNYLPFTEQDEEHFQDLLEVITFGRTALIKFALRRQIWPFQLVEMTAFII